MRSVPSRGSMKGLSRKKAHLSRREVLAASHVYRTRSHTTVITTSLVDRFFVWLLLLLLALPDLNSRFRGHLKRANHGSICDSSRLTRPMTISGYAWGHIVAYGP